MVQVLISFAQMNYIIDGFIDKAIMKDLQNIFSTDLISLYNLIYVPSSQPWTFSTLSNALFYIFFLCSPVTFVI